MSQLAQPYLDDLSRIEAHILLSELNVTRQQARLDNLERTGNDGSLSRSLLKNFKNSLELLYAHRAHALRQLKH